MNLRQLITSTHKVVSARWNVDKPFDSKPLGNVISLNLNGVYNPRNKTLRFDMAITAATQEFDTIRFFDNEDGYKGKHPMETPFISEERQEVHTHTCSIAFSDIEQITLNRKEVLDDYWETQGITDRKAKLGKVGGDIRMLEQEEKIALSSLIKKLKRKYGVERIAGSHLQDKEIILRTPISLNSQVKVKCTCGNFFYAFAWYNADNNCLIGNRPPEYEKFVDSPEAAPFQQGLLNDVTVMNENQVPGLCKHLQLLISILLDNKLMSSKYNDRFNEMVNPTGFVKEKLKEYQKISDRIIESEKKLAKEELRKFNSDMRRKGNEIKLYYYYKKKKGK